MSARLILFAALAVYVGCSPPDRNAELTSRVEELERKVDAIIDTIESLQGIAEKLASNESQLEKIRELQSRQYMIDQQRQAEEDFLQTAQAEFSKLRKFEQDIVLEALDKIRRGEELNAKELRLLELGGLWGAAQAQRAKQGRAAGLTRERLIAPDR